jgi:hypothetical protein
VDAPLAEKQLAFGLWAELEQHAKNRSHADRCSKSMSGRVTSHMRHNERRLLHASCHNLRNCVSSKVLNEVLSALPTMHHWLTQQVVRSVSTVTEHQLYHRNWRSSPN